MLRIIIGQPRASNAKWTDDFLYQFVVWVDEVVMQNGNFNILCCTYCVYRLTDGISNCSVFGLLVRHSMLGPVGTPSELETPDKSRWFTPR